MKKYANHIAALLFAIVVLVLIYFIFDVSFGRALLFSLLAVALQVFAWRLFSYKSRIGFALSFLPAVFLVIYICLSGIAWLVCSAAVLLILVLFYQRQWVETREATQNWVASAIYFVLLAFMAAMLIA